MTLPTLLSISDIQARLVDLFPAGLVNRQNLIREMAAKTVFVFLYGGMVEGAGYFLRPSHIYFFTEDQSLKTIDQDRLDWIANSQKPGFRPDGKRWYADTTREPIRDETIRFGLFELGAVQKIEDIPITSSKPVYFLKKDFADIFDPSLTKSQVDSAILAWQHKYLTPAAKARMAAITQGAIASKSDVFVTLPNKTVKTLSAGPSSIITKAVAEDFTQKFLSNPAVIWLSESGKKVSYYDNMILKSFGMNINAASILPDIILMDLGSSGSDTYLIFIEVVATDGPMDQIRKDALLKYVDECGFATDQCFFGTAFEDRASPEFKKCMPKLGWGTFFWFMSEPDCLIWLYDKPLIISKAKSLFDRGSSP